MIRSLRMRLFLGVTVVSAMVLGILCVAVDQAVRRTLQAEFDNVLTAKALSLASMVEQQGAKIHFDYQQAQFPEFEAGPRASYFEILVDEKPFEHSPSLADGHLAAATNGASAVILPDGRTGRQVKLSFQPYIETDEPQIDPKKFRHPGGVLLVAQDSADLDRTLGRIRMLTVLLCGAATLLSGAALLAVASRAVRPVRALAGQIESLGEHDLSTVLDADAVPTELKPVVDRLNGMLRRLGDAFNRERGFTADVAHELRTPLAGLLATLEVCRSRPRDAGGYEVAIDKCLHMLTAMQGLVANLLLLARADSGQLTVRKSTVDLGAMVIECWQPLEDAARSRDVSLAFFPTPTMTAMGDPEFLRIVLRNLLDNALNYANAGSQIKVQSLQSVERAGVKIANVGHALVAGDVSHLFQRFWRKDAARTSTGSHAGLGLSICQRLLTLQGGTIAVALEGEAFVVTIDLPAGERT